MPSTVEGMAGRTGWYTQIPRIAGDLRLAVSVQLIFTDGSACDVTRSGPESSWVGTVACPVCGINPIRVRAYDDDPPAPHRTGFVSALAWCAGRHASVGILREPAMPNVLVPMGVGEPEAFRCRIY